MLYLYLGTDRAQTHKAMHAAIEKIAKGRERIHISDVHTVADLDAALGGAGLFGKPQTVILDSIMENEDMRTRLEEALPHMRDSADTFFILEEKPNAAAKKMLGKYAEKTETFDAVKKEKDNAIFKLRFALEKGDKKVLWVGLMREFIAGRAPEAVHGFLFWSAKQMFMSARNEREIARAQKLVIELAELPHESRRRGFDLEYALERFVLSQA
jgi:hypothetical protein